MGNHEELMQQRGYYRPLVSESSIQCHWVVIVPVIKDDCDGFIDRTDELDSKSCSLIFPILSLSINRRPITNWTMTSFMLCLVGSKVTRLVTSLTKVYRWRVSSDARWNLSASLVANCNMPRRKILDWSIRTIKVWTMNPTQLTVVSWQSISTSLSRRE